MTSPISRKTLGIERVLSVEYDADARNLTTVKLLVEDWSHPKWTKLKKLLEKSND